MFLLSIATLGQAAVPQETVMGSVNLASPVSAHPLSSAPLLGPLKFNAMQGSSHIGGLVDALLLAEFPKDL